MQSTKSEASPERRVAVPQLVVGTEGGLFGLSEEHGAWNAVATFLPGLSVSGIAREGASSMLVSTQTDGLFRVDLVDGTVAAVAADVLPKIAKGVTISPLGPTIFVATEPAGIWSSTDGGRSWTENAAVKAIFQARGWKYPVKTVAPHIRNVLVSWDDPRYVYAAIQVGGILHSEDSGTSWTDVSTGFDPDIHQLFQHPTDPTLLYAVGGGGGWVDETPRPLPAPMGRPLFRSRDRGRSWECISTDFDRCYGIGMSGTPTSPATLVTGVGRDQPPNWSKRESRADAIVLMSRDDGTTWQQCRAGLPDHFPTMIEAVEVDRKHGNRVLIGLGGTRQRNAAGERLVETAESAIYVSDDPALAWSRLPVTLPGISTIVAL